MAFKHRIPVGDDYLVALGRATYHFAYLEAGAVWVGETIGRGFIDRCRTLTAGQIGGHLIELAAETANDEDHHEITEFARVFADLVVLRNKLIHGRPYTAKDGVQQLQYNGKHGLMSWPVHQIESAAEAFQDAALQANRIIHNGRYAAYQRQG
jgi:hypothetical protein